MHRPYKNKSKILTNFLQETSKYISLIEVQTNGPRAFTLPKVKQITLLCLDWQELKLKKSLLVVLNLYSSKSQTLRHEIQPNMNEIHQNTTESI